MNKIILIGNLTRDPESNTTTSGVNFTRFCIAVNRPYTSASGDRFADYFDIVCWRQLADRCAKYLYISVVSMKTAKGSSARLSKLLPTKWSFSRRSKTPNALSPNSCRMRLLRTSLKGLSLYLILKNYHSNHTYAVFPLFCPIFSRSRIRAINNQADFFALYIKKANPIVNQAKNIVNDC